MANNPNVGPEPVDAQANHVREKTYIEPAMPKRIEAARRDLPETTVEDKVRDEMPAAIDAIKQRL